MSKEYKRLTKRRNIGLPVVDCGTCEFEGTGFCTVYQCRSRLIERLADFEDMLGENGFVPPKYSEWTYMGELEYEDGTFPVYRCKSCGIPRDEKYRYCPSCGAKMTNSDKEKKCENN